MNKFTPMVSVCFTVTWVMLATAAERNAVKADAKVAQTEVAEPFLKAYKLKTADRDDVIRVLCHRFPRFILNDEGRPVLIHAFATAETHRQIEALIRKLDGSRDDLMQLVISLYREIGEVESRRVRRLIDIKRPRPNEKIAMNADLQVKGCLFLFDRKNAEKNLRIRISFYSPGKGQFVIAKQKVLTLKAHTTQGEYSFATNISGRALKPGEYLLRIECVDQSMKTIAKIAPQSVFVHITQAIDQTKQEEPPN